MIYISEEQKEYLKDFVNDIDKLIKKDNLQDFLDAIDDEIINNILRNNDEPDAIGIKLQKIYDQIYNQNC